MELEISTIKEVTESIGGNEELLYEMIDKLRLWLQQQSHLPQGISDKHLTKAILTSKFNMEKAKNRLDSLYTLRTLIPEFFENYDPLIRSTIESLTQVQWVPLPKLTPDKSRITFIRYLKKDPNTFSPPKLARYAFMTTDVRIDEDMVSSEIAIWDCIHMSFIHMTKYTPSILKKVDLVLEAYGLRYKAIYFINTPAYVDQLLKLTKMMMKPKIYERIHALPTGIKSLYEYIPKSILPADYGGEEPSLDTLSDMWHKKLIERRDWLLGQEKLKTNESLRIDRVINQDDLFGVAGTFRQLQID